MFENYHNYTNRQATYLDMLSNAYGNRMGNSNQETTAYLNSYSGHLNPASNYTYGFVNNATKETDKHNSYERRGTPEASTSAISNAMNKQLAHINNPNQSNLVSGLATYGQPVAQAIGTSLAGGSMGADVFGASIVGAALQQSKSPYMQGLGMGITGAIGAFYNPVMAGFSSILSIVNDITALQSAKDALASSNANLEFARHSYNLAKEKHDRVVNRKQNVQQAFGTFNDKISN